VSSSQGRDPSEHSAPSLLSTSSSSKRQPNRRAPESTSSNSHEVAVDTDVLDLTALCQADMSPGAFRQRLHSTVKALRVSKPSVSQQQNRNVSNGHLQKRRNRAQTMHSSDTTSGDTRTKINGTKYTNINSATKKVGNTSIPTSPQRSISEGDTESHSQSQNAFISSVPMISTLTCSLSPRLSLNPSCQPIPEEHSFIDLTGKSPPRVGTLNQSRLMKSTIEHSKHCKLPVPKPTTSSAKSIVASPQFKHYHSFISAEVTFHLYSSTV